MKLEVDFSELELAAAKMQGLGKYLELLRTLKYGYDHSLALAMEFVADAGGTVVKDGESTTLNLNGEEATCFQPYDDIDLFYFEN